MPNLVTQGDDTRYLLCLQPLPIPFRSTHSHNPDVPSYSLFQSLVDCSPFHTLRTCNTNLLSVMSFQTYKHPLACHGAIAELDSSETSNSSSNMHQDKENCCGHLAPKPFRSAQEVIASGFEHEPGQGDCCICLEIAGHPGDKDHTLIRLKMCGHAFGKRCFLKWLGKSSFCPICRGKLFEQPESATLEVWETLPSTASAAPPSTPAPPASQAATLVYKCQRLGCGEVFSHRNGLRRHARWADDHHLCDPCAIVFDDCESHDRHCADDRYKHPRHCPIYPCDSEYKLSKTLQDHLIVSVQPDPST